MVPHRDSIQVEKGKVIFMKIEKWKFLISDYDMLDKNNDNIDVSVTLENGETFIVVIATVKNIEQQISNEGKGYLPPGCPQIIVDSLTEDIVNRALSEFADSDAHWLKFHHCSDIISTEDLEKIYKEFYSD